MSTKSTKINHRDLIKEFRRYRKSRYVQECSYETSQYPKWTRCKQKIDPASHNFTVRFCAEHWPICKFCDNKFPKFTTGRVKHRCDCKESVDYCKSFKDLKTLRTVIKELIEKELAKLGLGVNWAPGSGYYSATIFALKSKTIGLVSISILIDENTGSVKLDQKTFLYSDPEFAVKITAEIYQKTAEEAEYAVSNLNHMKQRVFRKIEASMKFVDAFLNTKVTNDKINAADQQFTILYSKMEELVMYLKSQGPIVEKKLSDQSVDSIED